jgi:predicted permease
MSSDFKPGLYHKVGHDRFDDDNRDGELFPEKWLVVCLPAEFPLRCIKTNEPIEKFQFVNRYRNQMWLLPPILVPSLSLMALILLFKEKADKNFTHILKNPIFIAVTISCIVWGWYRWKQAPIYEISFGLSDRMMCRRNKILKFGPLSLVFLGCGLAFVIQNWLHLLPLTISISVIIPLLGLSVLYLIKRVLNLHFKVKNNAIIFSGADPLFLESLPEWQEEQIQEKP